MSSDGSGNGREFRSSVKSFIMAQGFTVSVQLVASHCDLLQHSCQICPFSESSCGIEI
ncbi:hypothetical protein NC652_031973 [Populus alba x Populus x berolinensis]|uniref:Uncharacterized protein n=1 Tax=Populus alba x Populus x berolinensis TaxID=444605 RepID=A0AAD6LZP2_9ROSI|nr:hypothetical protein NC652_031973 [Populus alba x Populus x berolinensis]KAJ6976081.1 hypothetical protein NC653_031800 [Populus alba x Populus x berolinensis]